MFKFFLYIALCVCLIYVNFANQRDPALEILGQGEYCIYSRDNILLNPTAVDLIIKRIESGIGYIYYCKSQDAKTLRPLFFKIDGESLSLCNTSQSANTILRKLKYKAVSSDISGNLYGYSDYGKTFVKNGNKKINLQISIRNNTTTIGWPVILGSY